MGYTVKAEDAEKITLNQTDLVASVKQNVALILSTRQQSAPLGRSFGLPMQFIGRPIDVAEVILTSEIEDAIEEFEPRATVTDITFEIDPENPGRLVPTVEIEIVGEGDGDV